MDAINNTITNTEPEPRRSWRDVLKVHPAADLFPLLSPDELKELTDDIAANGLREPVTLFKQDDGSLCLLDGRNRLDALELLGRLRFPDLTKRRRGRWEPYPIELDDKTGLAELLHDDDPYALVISKNVRRRHLTPEQKRPLVETLLKSSTELSNRLLAEMAGVDHHVVADVREGLVSTGEIPQLETTIGKDGKARPVRRTPTLRLVSSPSPAADYDPAISAEIKSKPTPTAGFLVDKFKSMDELSEFKRDCTTRLPKMDAADRAEAIKYAIQVVDGLGES